MNLITHLFVLFFETVLLSSFGACLGTYSVDQTDLELTEIHLPLPPKGLELKVCATTAWLRP